MTDSVNKLSVAPSQADGHSNAPNAVFKRRLFEWRHLLAAKSYTQWLVEVQATFQQQLTAGANTKEDERTAAAWARPPLQQAKSKPLIQRIEDFLLQLYAPIQKLTKKMVASTTAFTNLTANINTAMQKDPSLTSDQRRTLNQAFDFNQLQNKQAFADKVTSRALGYMMGTDRPLKHPSSLSPMPTAPTYTQCFERAAGDELVARGECAYQQQHGDLPSNFRAMLYTDMHTIGGEYVSELGVQDILSGIDLIVAEARQESPEVFVSFADMQAQAGPTYRG